MNKEIRTLQSPAESELRMSSDGKTVEGYAAVFNSDSQPIGTTGFIEQLAPGCFGRCLAQKPDVILNRDHNPSILLARTKSGTLSLAQDAKGLQFKAALPDTSDARDLATLIKRGDIAGCSFAFTVARDGDEWNRNGSRRLIREIGSLYDVAICGQPAYEATSVGLRSLTGDVQSTGVYICPTSDISPDELEWLERRLRFARAV